MTTKQAVTIYYCFQALAGGVWWLALVNASIRDAFWSEAIPQLAITSFAFADIPLYVVGSIVCALLIAQGSKHAKAVAWLVAGAAAYAGLFCFGQYAQTGEAAAAVVAMGFSVIGSLWAAVNAP